MPQLDFFTFPHQYLIASLCFCGMYYFNLFFFFVWVKHLHLLKIFSLNALIADAIINAIEYNTIVAELFLEQLKLFTIFNKKNKKLQRKFFLKKLSSTFLSTRYTGTTHLVLALLVTFLLQFFFFKNFLIFNAEKLMLLYFLTIVFTLFIFGKKLLKNLLLKDLNKFLFIVCEIEEESNKAVTVLRSYLHKLKTNTLTNQLEFLLLKNLEVKLIKRVKW